MNTMDIEIQHRDELKADLSELAGFYFTKEDNKDVAYITVKDSDLRIKTTHELANQIKLELVNENQGS